MKKTLQTNIAMNDSYATRLCYTHTEYTYITIITNEHFGKIEKKHQTNIV